MAHCLASNASLYAYTNRGTLPLHGNAIHLLWISMNAEAECGLPVVRIPHNCGLIGCGIFVIRKDRQADFDRVQSMSDLRALTAAFRIS
ncbi:hypothetical protein OI25_4822 [Paraburkholderia fungorum]|uniref:Uncharacterized protein n=1 Tax=Paraburkholderia fungorum TaxID=134537 RepID=A0AAU8T699_9BURK|nr:hypothetical protein OI25_4822 [Paraburkholderia fungorum]